MFSWVIQKGGYSEFPSQIMEFHGNSMFVGYPYNVRPPSYKLVFKPHEYYSYLRTINHRLIGVMFTN